MKITDPSFSGTSVLSGSLNVSGSINLNGEALEPLRTPTVTSITPTSIKETDSSYSFTVIGTNFDNGATGILIGSNNTEFAPTTSTRNSATQLTLFYSSSARLTGSLEPYSVKVTNQNGFNFTKSNQVSINDKPLWITEAGRIGTVYAENSITASLFISASDEEGDYPISYSLETGTLPTGLSLITSSGEITGSSTILSGSGDTPSVSGVQYNLTFKATDNAGVYTTRNFNILLKWVLGSTPALAASSAEALYADNSNFSSGVYYIDTPDGGVQQVYCLNDGTNGWMLVGRVAADASSNITSTFSTQRALTDITQGGTSIFSADFGTYNTSRVMIWGATDFTNTGTTTINWIYGIPSSRPNFRMWISNIGSDSSSTSYTDMGLIVNGASNQKNGHVCDGAWDGPFKGSRWTNASYTTHGISDPSAGLATRVAPGRFSTPGSSAFYMNGAQDAKFSVSAASFQSGQDSDGVNSSLFGLDDNLRSFYDAYPSTYVNNSSVLDYSSAVTFWIR